MNNSMMVVDASVAMKTVFPDPLRDRCLALMERIDHLQPFAPTLWAYETVSATTKAIHFGIISQEEGKQALRDLSVLQVQLIIPDAEIQERALLWTIKLKRATAYDSFYLALAEVLDCPLWTADKRLYHALGESRPDWIHWIEDIDDNRR